MKVCEGYLKQMRELKQRLSARSTAVRNMLGKRDSQGFCGCVVPCCVLETERELLDQYLTLLERELFYLENPNSKEDSCEQTNK